MNTPSRPNLRTAHTDRLPRPRTTRGFAAVVSAVLLASAVSLTSCDEPELDTAPPPPHAVEIVQITTSDVPITYSFVGRTESSQRVEIRPRVAGFIDEIAYEEGEFVDEGQTLFVIDQKPFESQLRAMRAALAQQQARLENAESLLARVTPLAEAEAVAAKELDDAQDQVRSARAAVEEAAAGVYDAELNLSYTTITAPVRGLTGEATEREGAYISGTTGPITYVARINPIWAEFSIAESALLQGERREREGTVRFPDGKQFLVFLELSDGTRHPEPGRISFADASVSTETGSVLFRAEIPNPRESLRPGQFVRVHIEGAVRPNAMTVPQRAVKQGSKGAFVWVVNEQSQAEQRPVSLGPWRGDNWIIEQGLNPGDRVVVNGSLGLRPLTVLNVVRIIQDHSPTSTAPQPTRDDLQTPDGPR